MSKQLIWKGIFVIAVTAFAAFFATQEYHLGLDLKGGAELLYEMDKELEPNDLNRVVKIIRNRIDPSEIKQIKVEVQAGNDLLIQLPGYKDAEVEKVKNRLSQQGVLTFRVVSSRKSAKAPKGFEWVDFRKPQQDGTTRLLLSKEVHLTGEHIAQASVSDASGGKGFEVSLTFNAYGANIFSWLTQEHVGDRLAIVLDGKIECAPVVEDHISGGRASITGGYTYKEAEDLVTVLNAGSLPVKLGEPKYEFRVGPTLGRDSIAKGKFSIMVAGLLVIFFMLAYYRKAGLIADIVLLLNLVYILGLMVFFNATLTLPGIAGILLTVGMAVDANILVFERIREELKIGRAISLAVRNGFDRALVTILDANITTLIIAMILIFVGTGAIKGFAVILAMGIVCTLFAVLFVSRLLFELLLSMNMLNDLKMLEVFSNPNYSFIKKTRFTVFISGLLIVLGIGFCGYRGKASLDIDFNGGVLVEVKTPKNMTTGEVRGALKGTGYEDVHIQSYIETGKEVGKSDSFTFRVDPTTAGKDLTREQFKKDFRAALNNALKLDQGGKVVKVVDINPTVAQGLRIKGLVALVLGLLAILVYIRLRFAEFTFGLGAVAALIHDVIISIGVFVFWGYFSGGKIDLTIVAGMLTIVGYSINDTIVVFDRIRENFKRDKRSSLTDLVNNSVNQTLSRTIWTSFTTFIAVLTLFLAGGSVLNGFAFILMAGVVVGTYSSIFVASPVMIWLNKRAHAKAAAAE